MDAFYVWGFPFETMEDFNQTLFQMVSFRMMGARILPSLLSFLPQTPIYEQWGRNGNLEFCPYLLPEFVLTGHEADSVTRRVNFLPDPIAKGGSQGRLNIRSV